MDGVASPRAGSCRCTHSRALSLQASYRRSCAKVTQASHHWACLSAREHVEFAVALHQPQRDAAARAAATAALLGAMGERNDCAFAESSQRNGRVH